jgi:2'-5' RNA ligase
MRLFVAINLADDVRQSVWRSVSGLRNRGYPIKWVRPESVHLTLKFLGDVPEGGVVDVQAGIRTAAAGEPPFELLLSGFGAFPNPRRARVVWIGCHSGPSLGRIQQKLEGELEEAGFPREQRSFHPHITLGRVRRDARPGSLSCLADQLERLHFEATSVVESVDLMQSELSRSGARYTRLRAEILSNS